MAKQTSYQKLKQAIFELRRDLIVVCCNPESAHAEEIIQYVKFSTKYGNIVTLGSGESNGKGLLDITNEFEPNK